MGNLLLNSLEIRNFRGFHHLQIEHLGRVNLIVGKNNIGKSSLLEALLLYARKAPPGLLWEILGVHDESKQSSSNRYVDIEEMLSALKYLFYGRGDLKSQLDPIQIGPINSYDDTLSVAINWYTTQIDEEGNPRTRPLQPEECTTTENLTPRFIIQVGGQPKVYYSLNFDTFTAPSTASRKFRRSLETDKRPFVGPVKGPIGRAIVVSNKGQDAGTQLLHGEATEPGKQATNQDREPDLNLVEKGDCVGECRRSEYDGLCRRERPRGCSCWRDGRFCL